jgi:hypothetical protein
VRPIRNKCDAVECMRQIIYDSQSLSLRRPIVRLLGAFASIALILAGAGLFAVLAHSIAERKREIGIRMAVGARQTQSPAANCHRHVASHAAGCAHRGGIGLYP